MDNRIDRIIECLNKLRNTFKRETNQLYKDTESSMLANEKTVANFVKNTENCYEILVVAERNGTSHQKFTTFENARHQICSHYSKLKSELSENVVVHFTVKASTILNDLDETLNSVGTVEISTYSSRATRDVLLDTDRILTSLDSRTKVSTEMCAAQVEKRDLMTLPVTFVKAVTKKELGSNMFFTGGTYIANGRLVMADYNLGGGLFELDDKYSILKEYKIRFSPIDLSAGNTDNEICIAAVYSNGRYIIKCLLHDDLKIVSKIKAPSDTWGIAVNGDNIVVGTVSAVVILSQNGSTVRSIHKSGDSYVAVSQTQRTIYHTDNNDVVCRTCEGQEVRRYKHQQLKTPCGIDIDGSKNVYICGYRSHNVLQISSDGQRSRIIQLHNMSVPCTVVVHPQKKEFVVTSFEEDTVFEVYRLG